MRRDGRSYLTGSESLRPYSEIRAERDGADPIVRVLSDIAALEAESRDAAAAGDAATAKTLQCDAEALRCDLYHAPKRRLP